MRAFDLYTTDTMLDGRPAKIQRGIDAARMINIMKNALDEAGLLETKDFDDIANVLFGFEATLPKYAQEELRHG